MSYTKKVYDKLQSGRNGDVDLVAEQLSAVSFTPRCGVTVKASILNSGKIFVGNSKMQNGGTGDTDCGYELDAGESVFLPIDDISKVYVAASVANQIVYWIAV